MATMAQAIRLALHYAETHYGVTDIFGEDVGAPLGGVFTCTQGLETAWNSPLDERGIIGAAIGIAMTGRRCVAEIQFADYIFNTIDLLKLAGNTYWASHGQVALPLVVMTPVGGGIHGSLYHSHSFDSWAVRMAGWKIVIPSNSLDAYGLMLSSILDPNPVLYLIPKALLRVRSKEKIPGEPEDENELRSLIDAPIGDRTGWKPRWPPVQEYLVPIGKGKRVLEGSQVSVITWGRYVSLVQEWVQQDVLPKGGSVDLIDLRSIYPYDWPLIRESVQKTGRVLIINEDDEVANFGEHLAYRIQQELFYQLLAPVSVVAGHHVPGIGLHPHLEQATLPNKDRFLTELWTVIEQEP